MLCQTAYQIVIDRAAKIARSIGERLDVRVEHTGTQENRLIQHYHGDLIESGITFSEKDSRKYAPLGATEFSETLFKNVKFRKKENPVMQIADLMLYPIVRGRYDPAYISFQSMKKGGVIIDSALLPDQVKLLGVKYSCFDNL